MRFGVFEADLRSGELRKSGVKVKIQELPFRLLKFLLSRPNEVLNREQLREALWPGDVFVDFDRGIYTAINRLREALGDSAENPVFLETVGRRGYRWIAPAYYLTAEEATRDRTSTPATPSEELPPAPAGDAPGSPVQPDFTARYVIGLTTRAPTQRRFRLWLIAALVVAAGLAGFAYWRLSRRAGTAIVVLPSIHHPPDSAAQDLYLKGRFYFEKRTPDDLAKAVDAFTQAIVHDSNYAQAYVGLADSYNLLREFGTMPVPEAEQRALAAAQKAVDLDPQLAEAHASLGFAKFWGFLDASGAEHEFKRAIELDARLARAHHWYATFLVSVNRPQDALKEIELARQLDPSSQAILADKGFILSVAGRTEEARNLLRQMGNSDPSFRAPHRYLAEFVYAAEGNYSAMLDERRTAAGLKHDAAAEQDIAAQRAAYQKGGVDELYKYQLSAVSQAYEQGTAHAYDVAGAYANLHQHDETMKYLEEARQHHDPGLAGVETDLEFRWLHSDPDFRKLVVSLGLPALP